MTRKEHILICIAEECMEVAQRVTKALRFGLAEVQPGQPENNAQRVTYEVADLFTMLTLAEQEGLLSLPMTEGEMDALVEAKLAKFEKFLAYSKECGTVNE